MEQPFSASEPLLKVRFADSTNGWILGKDHIFKTTDAGNSWLPQDSSGGEGSALTVLNTDTAFYSGVKWLASPYFGVIRKTTNGGSSWETVDSLLVGCFDIQFLNDQVGYAGGGTLPYYHPTLRKTTDGGSTWFNVWSGSGGYEIRGLYFLNPDDGWIVLYDAVLMKTTDGGVSWAVSDTISPDPHSLLPLKDITFTTPDSGWAVGGIQNKSIVVQTTDAGSHWDYMVFFGSSLREIKFINSKVGWFCGANNSEPFISKTTDGGENWITQHQIPYSPEGAESISLIDTSIGWVVNYAGEIYKTTNGGVTFIEGGNLPSQPNSMHLFQNYPNPFNPVTSIKYTISSRQNVAIKVYDLLGKEVALLVNEEKPAGTYELTWDGANMPSGVYFYKIKAGDPSAGSGQVFTQTKKMILLK
jgi:photosystem II stability/assembly factor-like uncharacterized protein